MMRPAVAARARRAGQGACVPIRARMPATPPGGGGPTDVQRSAIPITPVSRCADGARSRGGPVTRPATRRAAPAPDTIAPDGSEIRLLATRAEPIEIGPGDTLVIPTGWAFQFSAAETGLRFLCYTAPPWPGADEAEPVAEGGLGSPTV